MTQPEITTRPNHFERITAHLRSIGNMVLTATALTRPEYHYLMVEAHRMDEQDAIDAEFSGLESAWATFTQAELQSFIRTGALPMAQVADKPGV